MPLFSVESRTRAPTKRKQKAAQKKKKKQEGMSITLQVGDLIKRKFPSQKAEQGKQKKKKKPLGTKGGKGTPERTEKPGVPHGVDKKTQEGGQILNVAKGGSVSKFPDLSGDGKVTQKDILMGRGVIKKRKGGKVTGRSIGPAGASIVSDDGKRIKQLKTIAKSLASPATAGLIGGFKKAAGQLAGRLARRGYGKARR